MISLIRLENVSKIYKMGEVEVAALVNINIEINKKEFVAIVGPSGSGKSTLMHIIGLLDTPSEGRVFLRKKDTSRLNENQLASLRNKHIGFVFQAFNLLPRTSALDNVMLPLLYSRVNKKKRNSLAKDVLSKVALGDRLYHHPSQLSGGQQQRVAIARALINEPGIILADEPTGNLDSKSGREIMNLLGSLNRAGQTIVLVTHELDIATSCKRIVELKDGRIVSDRMLIK